MYIFLIFYCAYEITGLLCKLVYVTMYIMTSFFTYVVMVIYFIFIAILLYKNIYIKFNPD